MEVDDVKKNQGDYVQGYERKVLIALDAGTEENARAIDIMLKRQVKKTLNECREYLKDLESN